jgi:hypothetical protein
MKILQKLIGLFGFVVIRKTSKAVYRDCNGVKFVRFTKE